MYEKYTMVTEILQTKTALVHHDLSAVSGSLKALVLAHLAPGTPNFNIQDCARHV